LSCSSQSVLLLLVVIIIMMKQVLVLSAILATTLAGLAAPDGIFPRSHFIAPKIHQRPLAAGRLGEDCRDERDLILPRLGANCSVPTVASCRGDQQYHPYPCDCHRYFQCTDSNTICFYLCDAGLVFNPISENCEFEYTAPPGLCQDTTVPPEDTTTPPTTTPATTPSTAPTTAPAPTTTKAPTTTTKAPTTSTEKTTPSTTASPSDCWICDECVCTGDGIDQEGFFKPYPGDCHRYYGCEFDASNTDCPWTSTGPYDCGDWVFNPDQASCVWPELAPPELCE